MEAPDHRNGKEYRRLNNKLMRETDKAKASKLVAPIVWRTAWKNWPVANQSKQDQLYRRISGLSKRRSNGCVAIKIKMYVANRCSASDKKMEDLYNTKDKPSNSEVDLEPVEQVTFDNIGTRDFQSVSCTAARVVLPTPTTTPSSECLWICKMDLLTLWPWPLNFNPKSIVAYHFEYTSHSADKQINCADCIEHPMTVYGIVNGGIWSASIYWHSSAPCCLSRSSLDRCGWDVCASSPSHPRIDRIAHPINNTDPHAYRSSRWINFLTTSDSCQT